MRAVIASHGHCFDGLASAVLCTGLIRHNEPAPVAFEYISCGYGPGQKDLTSLLTGTHNAILDYRFFPMESLNWYFDHHRTAFASPEDEAWFRARQASRHFFYDSGYSSCTRFIADIGRERFGWQEPLLEDLVRWADVIDAARYESAAEAIDRTHPVQQLANVVEQLGDSSLYQRLVPELLSKGLMEVAQSSWVTTRFKPIRKSREKFLERIKRNAQERGPVVFVDLTEANCDTLAKFITYAVFPESTYSVVVARLGGTIKISIGHNPWSGQALAHDISAMCARYGGGGHPYVGGISFRAADVEHARSVATQLCGELGG